MMLYTISSHIPMTAASNAEWKAAARHLTLYCVTRNRKLANRYQSIFSHLMLKKAAAHRQVYKRLSTTSLPDRERLEKIAGWHIAEE